MKGITLATTLLFLAALSEVGAAAGTAALEQTFLFTEEELVTTASKRAQSAREAQSATSVIDGEDVMCCVPLSIPQALRAVPGLDIATVTTGDANLATRGFNGPLSNRMLVMMEGRSIDIDLYGMTPWGYFPLSRHEIDRIEVIRGPGAARYGPNTFGGVVNIVTKPPEQIQGTRLGVCVGSDKTFETTILHAAVLGRFDYKVSGSWGETKRWSHR